MGFKRTGKRVVVLFQSGIKSVVNIIVERVAAVFFVKYIGLLRQKGLLRGVVHLFRFNGHCFGHRAIPLLPRAFGLHVGVFLISFGNLFLGGRGSVLQFGFVFLGFHGIVVRALFLFQSKRPLRIGQRGIVFCYLSLFGRLHLILHGFLPLQI